MDAVIEVAEDRTIERATRRRIRVCMVSFYFPPNYSGSAVQALNLSRHLLRLGVDPFVVAANLSGAPAEEAIDGIPVRRLSILAHPSLRVPSFMLALLWFLYRHRREYDVIHAHGTLQHGAVALAGRLFRKPTVLKVAMANSDIAFARQGRLLGRVNRFFVSRFDRYIATTPTIAAEFAAQGLNTSRVQSIPNGVDTERFRPAATGEREGLQRELRLPDGPLVAFVGIITARKNVDGILRMFRDVVQNGAPGHLLLIGPIPGGEQDPFYRSALRFIADSGLGDRVSFLGQVPDVDRYLRASDVFLFPSRQEGMPNVVLEAMASGLACVASDGTGTEALIRDGVDGFRRALDDEAGFAAVLERLLRDGDLRRQVGTAARAAMSDRFSLTAVANHYRALYDDLTSRTA